MNHALRQAHRAQAIRELRFDLVQLVSYADAIDVANAARKRFAADEATFKQYQKADRETAQFFKQAANDERKSYRAACLVLGWLAPDYSGDAQHRRLNDWPDELMPAARSVINHIDCLVAA